MSAEADRRLAEYERAHAHPANRACHALGIPAIVASLALLAASLVVRPLRAWGAGLFVAGWILQFAGHACEGTRPEFMRDWRFLFVGVRWWRETAARALGLRP